MILNTRLLIILRMIIAFVIGYGLAILYSIAFSKILIILGFSKANATVTAQLISFLIYTTLIIMIFSIKSLKKICLYTIYSIIFCTSLIYIVDIGVI